jgi:hypothetical protein
MCVASEVTPSDCRESTRDPVHFPYPQFTYPQFLASFCFFHFFFIFRLTLTLRDPRECKQRQGLAWSLPRKSDGLHSQTSGRDVGVSIAVAQISTGRPFHPRPLWHPRSPFAGSVAEPMRADLRRRALRKPSGMHRSPASGPGETPSRPKCVGRVARPSLVIFQRAQARRY